MRGVSSSPPPTPAAEPDVPRRLYDRVSRICLSLPESTIRTDRWAHAFQIRRRVFAFLLSHPDPAGLPVPLLVIEADDDERRALLEGGHPYFAPGSGRRRLGIVLDNKVDWEELAELITESYRLLAPKKLSALLD